MSRPNTSKQLLSIAIVVLFAALVAAAGSHGSTRVAGVPLFALCAAAAFLVNWLVFIPSSLAKTEMFFDLTGGVTYLAVTLTALGLSQVPDARACLVAALVVVWAVRLAGFLFLRIRRDGKDSRFDSIKTAPLSFFVAWTLQGLWVLLTTAAALAVLTGTAREPLGAFAFVGLVIWLVGFSIEVIADRQKSTFKAVPENAGRFITTGLWSWSRHPNYFGEIALWVGVAVMAFPALRGWQHVTLLSPLFVTLLLTRVSGIPLLEQRALERWGDDPTYQRYLKTTSALIPLPPKKTG